MFLKRYIEQFKQYIKGLNYSPRTIGDYGMQLKFFAEYLRDQDIDQLQLINKEALRNYQSSLFMRQPSISLETQYARLTAVKTFFRYLLKKNDVFYDPSAEIELPRRKKSLPRDVMSIKEVKKLLNQPDVDTALGLRDKAILEIFYSTRIRNQELRRLSIYDVNTSDGDLYVRQGKGQKDRVVPVGEIACGYVEEYIKHGRGELLKGKESKVLFVTKGGLPINAGNLIVMIRKYVKKAKIKKNVTPHPIRHTCATHLLKNKASLRYIQKLLGHESIETTQRYTRVEMSDLKKVHRQCHPRGKG